MCVNVYTHIHTHFLALKGCRGKVIETEKLNVRESQRDTHRRIEKEIEGERQTDRDRGGKGR